MSKRILLALCIALAPAVRLAGAATQGSRSSPRHGAPRLVPVGKGWARNQVNAIIFRRNSVVSHGVTQYVGYDDADARPNAGTGRAQAARAAVRALSGLNLSCQSFLAVLRSTP